MLLGLDDSSKSSHTDQFLLHCEYFCSSSLNWKHINEEGAQNVIYTIEDPR